ncbi:MAG: low molecular weight phosphotyrosine protein phosphatase [Kordiimonadaceae bacterium]|jgi:protein-tyrosine phosphatase|nr:low molecular weight phosphotyrosine protein phosphatase [Kordiimonadaceae bacterium]MBT6034987.1 low molecular weight phosphotyrosine protein phosphatase [Kordiimonadaceae bacterium]MBT6328306.1 low molecular weight phosphotyrosine protein phosphatase [Kordiimonadaceae bacterium]MBT7582160.1 low molecular weight phosphotyrosine protein phosphatase [Kordiimonadaceae bacterium]
MVKVLFVCLGNICRSPTAEGVFRHHANNAGIKDGFTREMFIDSAGTAGFHLAAAPDKRAQLTALKFGIDIGEIKARKLAQEDYADFDYLLAMDSEILRYMQGKCPENHLLKLHLFMSFSETSPGISEVPDPYYGEIDDFDIAYEFIDRAAQGFLKHIQNKHNL